MPRPSVLITKRISPQAVEYLRHRVDVDYVDSDEGLKPEELTERARGKQGIVSQLTDRLDDAQLSKLEGVKIVANVAVGYDNIDVNAATRRGILVTNTPDVLTDTTADLAFALMLAAARRIVEAHKFVHSGQWRRWTIDLLAGYDIHHKTLGIFGMGRIGQAVARRGRGFSMRVIYHDERRAAPDIERELNLEFVSKERLLHEADFISLHVPLLDSTRHYISSVELDQMKDTAIIVNTSRGPVVDEDALAEALRNKSIAAAGLDVFEREPQVTPLLLELENVVLAPHIGSASIDTRLRMSMLAAENCAAALDGRRPPTLVNASLWQG